MSVKAQFLTHDVENQPQPLPECNLWRIDIPLREAVSRHGADWAADHLDAHGALAGGELMALGELANCHRPVLHPFDRHGRRIDHVEFHPAYHAVMRHAMAASVHSFSWRNEGRPGAHVVRTALMYLNSQPEAGTGCPLTMTHAAIPPLRHSPAIAQEWIPRLLSTGYDPRTLPAARKTACTIGMGMTEKQGGSDVRSNATRALPQADGSVELVGHKFFFSAPMCDAHLVLAQATEGLGCFLVPRVLPDGSLNAVRIQRLKDKLGDWSNASSEVEFQGATAYPVGAPGRGIATILEMVALTRLDCITGSAAGMRQALVQALHHTRQRRAFGRLLIDQPLMRNVLADLVLESEAAIATAIRVAAAVDAASRDAGEAAFARVATAIGKYWVCKRAPAFVNEAQECLGGIGYVEENILPRLYRQAPLNSIWEGSGNVQCLDVLRAFRKEPETRDALFDELLRARGAHPDYDLQFGRLVDAFDDTGTLEVRSRQVVERIALLLQAALLFQSEHTTLAETFCRARLGEGRSQGYGALPPDVPFDALLERALPVL
ncbi:isovaleryl-CoA dehydrogenase [Xanthomonadaceae bacterium JHOS43]|nr:isovaleryl-CoA dehydrogenase [Xanthomonadaceae bacterium JHOS43]